mmetsp:Transcript_28493/g.33699  ORF Transcript_28493/g.33699 Transcript_28493/m.33699 type:complete len:176 (-) Transcript_28493:146-673(-)
MGVTVEPEIVDAVIIEAGDTKSLTSKLKDLQQSRDQGLISESEYQALRSSLINPTTNTYVRPPVTTQPTSSNTPKPVQWTAPYPMIKTEEIAGDWTCCCIPGGWACFKKIALDANTLEHTGLVCLFFGIPCIFTEKRIRHPNTNGFYKDGEKQNIDVYCNKNCVCNGISCSTKLF